ncbi:ABC transporter ATP-binding protein [Paenibacillus thalictri]|uniref:ABC transporter ATP-binding protein n=1 Tax=Paenibacillus thalictri TaxID=2527873 RepID=A0A4Q9DN15_9BACL|nr:ABC transporter ATP-binding protein [Paenibacillus thalictri]TBL73316.1 ABC transporter ATP-binding protein [Paenibacillus thalictri]
MGTHREKILEVRNLQTHFYTDEGISKAVDGIDFTLHKGETLGLVGESGCGKSITSLSILRLIAAPPGKIAGGEIRFRGDDLLKKTEAEMRLIRGNQISMIFQEPMTSLNPVYSVGEQIAEVFRHHQKLGRKEAWAQAVEMLRIVGIPSPEKRAGQEPFELSGGMRQRVMIAMAMACNPDILIADEPTTALDVTIQAQILDLMKRLQQQFGMGIIMITHDLGVVSETCDRVAVMYAGKIVEMTTAKRLFEQPKHPYTVGLLQSLPRTDRDQEQLNAIPGSVPSPYQMPFGCRFAPRCEHAKHICHTALPELTDLGDEDQVRCWMYTPEWHKQPEQTTKERILA